MREILFRGKRIDNGEWVEGFYYKAKYYRTDKNLCDYITIPHPEDYCKSSDHFLVNPETIGQYTGLTDKYGTKIFEGDILLVGDKQKVLVSFEKGQFVVNHYAINVLCSRNCESEVIGNIHDNPELLKGGEE